MLCILNISTSPDSGLSVVILQERGVGSSAITTKLKKTKTRKTDKNKPMGSNILVFFVVLVTLVTLLKILNYKFKTKITATKRSNPILLIFNLLKSIKFKVLTKITFILLPLLYSLPCSFLPAYHLPPASKRCL